MWLGRILSVIAIVGWVLFAWLLTHRSKSPVFFNHYSPEYITFLGFALAGVIALAVLAYLGVRRPAVLLKLRIGSSIGLLFGSIIVTLLVVEIFIRSVDLLGVSLFEEVTRYVIDLEHDEELVYKHRAGLDTVYQGVAFRTNEIGLRDRPIPEPTSDVLRVLVLGDSVTLGWGVPMEETFSAQLESELEERLGRPVRTINSGVSGYNTEQELTFLRRHVDSMAPDLVILLYVENDVEPQAENMLDMQRLWENPPGANATLLRWSWLYRIIYYVVPDIIGSPAVPQEDDRSGWERSMLALAEVYQETAKHDIEFSAFLFRFLPDDVTDALYADISRIADDQGFPFFDTLSWFKDIHIRSLINSFIDSHPNARGHQIIAKGIARSLEESGTLCNMASEKDVPACNKDKAK